MNPKNYQHIWNEDTLYVHTNIDWGISCWYEHYKNTMFFECYLLITSPCNFVGNKFALRWKCLIKSKHGSFSKSLSNCNQIKRRNTSELINISNAGQHTVCEYLKKIFFVWFCMFVFILLGLEWGGNHKCLKLFFPWSVHGSDGHPKIISVYSRNHVSSVKKPHKQHNNT